jgi:hypothetical protein
MIALLIGSFGYNSIAQIHINIGIQPIWGPVGYDEADYYYLPDIDAYYDVPHRQYVYMENNVWVTRGYLPPRYSNYDLYSGHKVVINEPRPWMHHDRYRTEYIQYRGRHDQQPIRDSRDNRYYANPGHPHHNEWHGNDHHDNGRHEGGAPGHGGDNHGPRGGDHGQGHEGGDRGQRGGGDRGQGHPGGDRGPQGGGDRGQGHEGGGHEGGGHDHGH